MQNIKKGIIDRLIELKPTAATIDVLLYIARYQSKTGLVKGVYYKDVCNNAGITPPTFYTAKKWLEDNKFISVTMGHDWLYDITILNNNFSFYPENIEELPENEKEEWRYLSVTKQIFTYQAFLSSKANEKLFIMQLMLDYHNKEYEINNLYNKYTKLFKVGRRAICNYLHTLKKRFKRYINLYIKNGKYYIKLTNLFKSSTGRVQADDYRYNLIRSLVFKFRIHATPREIDNVSFLLRMYKNKVEDKYPGLRFPDKSETVLLRYISKCIQECIERDNKDNPAKRKWVRQMKPKHIHAMLREKLIQLGVVL